METVKINRPAAAETVQAAPKAVEADVTTLILAGVVEREIVPEAMPGYKVKMHTLTDPERLAATREIGMDLLGNSLASQEAIKIPTLVQAITYLENNGVYKHFSTPEDKAALRTILSSAPALVVDILFVEYMKLNNDLLVLLETGVKKNSL